MKGKKLILYCPICEAEIEQYVEITFCEGFKILIKSECCDHALQALLDILPLLPEQGEKPN